MRAWRIQGRGGPEVLQRQDVPSPALEPDQVRVRVRAAALNRADLLQCYGRYPAPKGAPADIPGLEYAGEIVEVGPAAGHVAVGARVMGILGGGAFADEVVTGSDELLPIDARWSFAHAAAIPEAFLTTFDALVLQGGLRRGDAVLVHAVASGVGTAAVQLVNAWGGRVIGTSRTAERLERCRRELGLADGIVVAGNPPKFADEVLARTNGEGAALALELTGGDYLPETLRALAPRGRLLLVGLLAGASATIDLSALLSRRQTIIGTVLRSRPREEKAALARLFQEQALPHFEAGRLRPVIDEVFPFLQLPRALDRLARGDVFGKLVVEME